MRVTKLQINNFKSLKNVELECKKINLFIGKPNSGKSNILEALGLLSYLGNGSYQHPTDLPSFLRFENTRDIYHDNSLSEPIWIKFGFGNFRLIFDNGRFVGTYYAKDHAIDLLEAIHSGVSSLIPNADLKCFKFYRFAHLREFKNSASEFLQPPSGDNLLSIILTNRKIKKFIKDMLEEFGYRINLRPEEGKIEIVKEFEDVLVSFPYSLSSETLQRIIFFFTAVESNENSILTFEEPEAHAFPFYTKFLAETIALSERNNQYFIATHNPYLLTSILEKAPKDDVAVFITSFSNYQTKVTRLSEEKETELLEMGSDVFFNLDNLISQE